ncbi:MAG: leucine-rich repeat protein [Treponema sp.]|jgi:hypothetical protein|nr:leucine-rich repeat protein [Treponema sp.]
MKKTLCVVAALFSLLWTASFVSAQSPAAEDRGVKVMAAKYLGEQAQIGRQYALLIAINRYQEWPGLKNPVADAQEIRKTLSEQYYIDEFIELYDADATRAAIANAFTDLQRRLTTHDSLFIYYAGHGHQDQSSRQTFWIPVNAGLDKDKQDNWLANSAIRSYIYNLKAIHVFLVSDSCFSGDILNAEYAERLRPETIDNDYYRRAYALTSRQVLTSGSSEAVPDESEFSQALKLCLRRNTAPLLDPYGIYSEVRLSVHETTPLFGSLKQSGHQEGATFIFFRRSLQPPPSAASDWTPARDFDLELGERGVTIKKYKGKAERVTIPAEIDSIPVVKIGDSAFSGCSGLSSISIPGSVSSIGNGAFSGCSGLSSISIPDSVSSIGAWAFGACSGLTSISIPGSITAIGDFAFYGCRILTSIDIPGSVTAIGDGAFSGCSGLKSISIPGSVSSIGDAAFRGCSGLRSISIPGSVSSIGDAAFGGCSGLSSITVDARNTRYSAANGILFSKDGKTLVYYPAGKVYTSYTIPSSVSAIGEWAFYGCSGLSSINIPSSVTAIGNGAFSDCSGLSSISIPGSVSAIGAWAFYGCSGLSSISIPGSVSSIGVSAFAACSGLRSISIPGSVTAIGVSVFEACSGLRSISIPGSVTSIGYAAFRGCRSLTSINIPSSVTAIGNSAFRGCSGLSSINIPGSVTSIGDWAFSACRSLRTISIPGSVRSIGAWAFSACSDLTSISIPDSVSSIGAWAFSACSDLTSISIPDSVSSIGEGAFEACSSLRTISIPGSVRSIGNWAFFACSSLRTINIPDSVSSIGEGAFAACSRLTTESRKAIQGRFGDKVF